MKMTALSGEPNTLTVIQKGKVRSRARAQNIQEAKNFPHTNAGIDTGMVIIWRMVLVLNSSAQSLIEIPGMNSI